MTQIMDPSIGLEALREVGYKSTGTALAELVDNAIEANAADIDIIPVSKKVLVNNTMSLQVTQIAVLDNGDGMEEKILRDCLSLGWGTRLNKKDLKLGKFGFGLKGSSISQGRKVEVYSWQDVDWDSSLNTKVNMCSLDIDKVKDTKQTELDPVIQVALPDFVRKFGYKIKKHKSGTLVVWSNLDKLKFKRVVALINLLNKELCRIYRHFLIDGDFGKKRLITIQDINLSTGKVNPTILVPNDPLYLMTPNNLPDYEDESTNVYFEKPFDIPVKYEDQNGELHKSKIELYLTIAKPETQALGGSSAQGKHYHLNTGISFVRAGREIDFGSFGFITSVDPRHRWWSMEVRFSPELDHVFGVNNNKQAVNGIKALDELTRKDLISEIEINYQDKMLIDLNRAISDNISSMMKAITGRKATSDSDNTSNTNPVKEKVNQELSRDIATNTESKEHGKTLTTDEKIAEIIPFILKDNTSLDETQAEEIAKKTVSYQVELLTDEWPGNLFLDRKPAGNTSIGKINRNTAFYEKFWKKLEEEPDSSGHVALSIVLMALIRAEDELQVLMTDKKALSIFRQKWSDYIDRLLDKAAD
jgi:hypothetical protein